MTRAEEQEASVALAEIREILDDEDLKIAAKIRQIEELVPEAEEEEE